MSPRRKASEEVEEIVEEEVKEELLEEAKSIVKEKDSAYTSIDTKNRKVRVVEEKDAKGNIIARKTRYTG